MFITNFEFENKVNTNFGEKKENVESRGEVRVLTKRLQREK